MSELRLSKNGRDAYGLVSFLLRVHELQADAQTDSRRLLCVLFLWIGRLSAKDDWRNLLLRIRNEAKEY
jgi:hypothetical protein